MKHYYKCINQDINFPFTKGKIYYDNVDILDQSRFKFIVNQKEKINLNEDENNYYNNRKLEEKAEIS